MPSETTLTQQEQVAQFIENYYVAAIFQGRLAYCLMSVHAVNPNILN